MIIFAQEGFRLYQLLLTLIDDQDLEAHQIQLLISEDEVLELVVDEQVFGSLGVHHAPQALGVFGCVFDSLTLFDVVEPDICT